MIQHLANYTKQLLMMIKRNYLRFISSRSRVMSPVIIGSMSLMREEEFKIMKYKLQ